MSRLTKEEADQEEYKAQAAYEAAEQDANRTYNEATQEEWARIEPILKAWQTFTAPHFATRQVHMRVALKALEARLTQVRLDWGVCPKCNTPYSRFQTFCSNEKCDYEIEKT